MGSYTPLLDQEVHTVHIPESVRASGKPTLDIIAEGAAFLHKDGIVVLDNAISTEHLDTLNNKLVPEALEIANDPDHHFNFGKHTRNMDQAPPPTRDLMFKDVWNNPFAAAVLAAVMGPRPVIHYANGNTALQAPPEGRQPVHSDCEFQHPTSFIFACAINICLVDVSPQNGGTEVWVGSHAVSMHEGHNRMRPGGHTEDRDSAAADDNPDPLTDMSDGDKLLTIQRALLEKRRAHSPPVQISCKKGSLILRDLRLWHAGMPNLTPDPRIMLAFVASPRWWQGKSRIFLPENVKEIVDEWAREDVSGEKSFLFDAEFVKGEVDHKKLSSGGVNFDSGSEAIRKYRGVLGKRPGYWPRWY
jgi:hypothetical protein